MKIGTRIMSLLILMIMVLSVGVSAEGVSALRVTYYGIDTCSNCKEAEKLFEQLGVKYPGKIEIDYRDVSKKEMEEEFLVVTSENNLKTVVPTIIVQGEILQGINAIRENLENILVDYIETGEVKELEKGGEGTTGNDIREIYRSKFSNLSIAVILVASLLDGVNPCALAMLLFFMALLMALDDKKRALMAGISYCSAIFITYLSIGFGLLKALTFFSGLNHVMIGLYVLTIIICLYLIIADTKDYIALKEGREEDVKNALSKGVKHKIHNILRKQSASKYIVITTFVAGIAVALLEFSCTGQVYMPTISFIISQGSVKAITYLIIYNLGFIAPALFVTIMVYKSNDILTASNLLVTKRKYIKLASVVFYSVILIYFIVKIIKIL